MRKGKLKGRIIKKREKKKIRRERNRRERRIGKVRKKN